MECPKCSTKMVLTRATSFGEDYHYCRQCKKELSELEDKSSIKFNLAQGLVKRDGNVQYYNGPNFNMNPTALSQWTPQVGDLVKVVDTCCYMFQMSGEIATIINVAQNKALIKLRNIDNYIFEQSQLELLQKTPGKLFPNPPAGIKP